MTVQKDSTYSEENIPTSNWAKFETVWDAVKGTFKEVYDKIWEGDFPDQKVYVLENAKVQKVSIWADDKIEWVLETEEVWEINVWIKASNSYLLQRLKTTKPWDILAFAFIKAIPPKTKWHHPAKSIQIFKAWVDEEWLKQNQPATDDGELPPF